MPFSLSEQDLVDEALAPATDQGEELRDTAGGDTFSTRHSFDQGHPTSEEREDTAGEDATDEEDDTGRTYRLGTTKLQCSWTEHFCWDGLELRRRSWHALCTDRRMLPRRRA